jgi:hypothetical protein
LKNYVGTVNRVRNSILQEFRENEAVKLAEYQKLPDFLKLSPPPQSEINTNAYYLRIDREVIFKKKYGVYLLNEVCFKVFQSTNGLTGAHCEYLRKHLLALSSHRKERSKDLIHNKKLEHRAELDKLKSSIS